MREASVGAALVVLQACASSGSRAQTTAARWTDPSAHRISFVTVAPDVRLEVLDWGGSGPPLVFLFRLEDVAHGFVVFLLPCDRSGCAEPAKKDR